uniref:NADH dehydrogenase subunit 6 n=1 Tax=Fuscoporia viticola TaxID=139386 RepID=UPI0023AB2E87|nr:NADH dehydrogenase subunit 6 [Fuscoporia viticola]WCF76831.1 NADH dehydrogenase subunit 6 [Fuscoporia viticola]
MKNIFIDLLAFGTIFSSILVITSKNPVIAVTFLIAVFVNAAGYLILKGIGFIGISYIIVYVGAITVLFLFVIMMINIKLTDILETGSQYTKNLPLALAIGSVFLYEIFNIMPFSFNNVSAISALLNVLTNSNIFILNSDISALSSLDAATAPLLALDPNIADTTFTNFLQIQSIGQGLYTYGAMWLILSSIILLLAMVAPIFISKITKKDDNTNSLNNPLSSKVNSMLLHGKKLGTRN